MPEQQYSDMRNDVSNAYDKEEGKEDDHGGDVPEYCPSCGKKLPASNAGGASVGGGT